MARPVQFWADMSLIAAACMIATAPMATTIVDLPLAQPHTKVNFTLLRPTTVAYGYELTQARMFTTDAGTAVRLTYVNKTSNNQFDILETPAKGSNVEGHMKGLLKDASFELEILPETTFVAHRKSGVDMGFVGTLLSGPSAMQVLKASKPWKE